LQKSSCWQANNEPAYQERNTNHHHEQRAPNQAQVLPACGGLAKFLVNQSGVVGRRQRRAFPDDFPAQVNRRRRADEQLDPVQNDGL
jgi:hypothetical protein